MDKKAGGRQSLKPCGFTHIYNQYLPAVALVFLFNREQTKTRAATQRPAQPQALACRAPSRQNVSATVLSHVLPPVLSLVQMGGVARGGPVAAI